MPEQSDRPRGSRLTRRAVIGAAAAGVVAVAAYEYLDQDKVGPTRPAAATGSNPVVTENAKPGSADYQVGVDETLAVSDIDRQIQGYANRDSVSPGEPIDFHVATAKAQKFEIAFYRIGYYGGAGARLMDKTPAIDGRPGAVPKPDETGTIACDWPVSWTLNVPADWISGIYVAVFTSADGYRSYTPFTVRELNRRSDILVMQPTTTYQAYNMWPLNGVAGKSFYRGFYKGKLVGLSQRAVTVSFDRPYAEHGLPILYELDFSFARWAEQQQYDVTYATSTDLHLGLIDPEKYSAIIHSGHDEYWSAQMRAKSEEFYAKGTHLAYLAANSCYWHVRVGDAPDGRPARTVTCYKESKFNDVEGDPHAGPEGPTIRWRALDKNGLRSEQGFMGVQYNGIPVKPTPLVVKSADHWVWKGTGLKNGSKIPDLVFGEADGYDEEMPSPKKVTQTLLSSSPYKDSRGPRVQNTSLLVDKHDTMIFVGGTYNWPLALYDPAYLNEHVRTAMKNVVDRMLKPR